MSLSIVLGFSFLCRIYTCVGMSGILRRQLQRINCWYEKLICLLGKTCQWEERVTRAEFGQGQRMVAMQGRGDTYEKKSS
jgi:hypothetical protein